MPQLDSQVRFGFTTIYGTESRPAVECARRCKAMLTDNVPPALNNAGSHRDDSTTACRSPPTARRWG